jgi:hypothetical protein
MIAAQRMGRKSVYHLQVIVRGRRHVRHDARTQARWKLRYRLTATRRLARYHFRVVVPTDEGYPVGDRTFPAPCGSS